MERGEIEVTVGGEKCVQTTSERVSDIICTAPLEPPGGENPAIINVSNCIIMCVTVPSGDRWEQHQTNIG